MTELKLYLAQRISAMIMAPLVLLHLGVMIYAIQGGLSADEILQRTRGSLFWGATYGLFVFAVAIHAAVGLRNILREWGRVQAPLLGAICGCFGIALLLLGGRAVFAVVAGG